MSEEKQTEKKTREVEPIDPELTAMRRILRTLNTLPARSRARVVAWAAAKAADADTNLIGRPLSPQAGNGFAAEHHAS